MKINDQVVLTKKNGAFIEVTYPKDINADDFMKLLTAFVETVEEETDLSFEEIIRSLASNEYLSDFNLVITPK